MGKTTTTKLKKETQNKIIKKTKTRQCDLCQKKFPENNLFKCAAEYDGEFEIVCSNCF